MGIYENNLLALSKSDKALEEALQEISTNSNFEVFLAENATADYANIIDLRDTTSLYKTQANPEITEKLKEFKEYENYPYLYFFGIGNGNFYKKLLKNKNHQCIMIFEPEIELIYIALNLVDFSKEIVDKRLVINISSKTDKVYLLKNFLNNSKFYLKVYKFHIYSEFYDKYTDEILRINSGIIDGLKQALVTLGNDVDDLLLGLKQSLDNFPQMIKSATLKELFKKAANTKLAVIVATGPSLEKQLPLLKEMQEHITILSLDASFRILVNYGIKPDIVFSLERIKFVEDFFKDIAPEKCKDVIFEFPSLAHPDALKAVCSEINYYMRRDFYNEFFELDEWGYLSGGSSVANIAYNFATKCDFDNIVLIGQDLSFSEDGTSHSKEHFFGENEVSTDEIYCDLEAYGGNNKYVKTTFIWKVFLDFYSMQIKDSSTTTYNSTEGGARIHGTIEAPFRDVLDRFTDKTKPKNKIVLKKPSLKSSLEYAKKLNAKKLEAIQIGKKMALDAMEVLQELDNFLLDTKDYNTDDIEEKIDLKYLQKLIDDIDKIKAKYNLEPFASLYAPLLSASIANHEYDTACVVVMLENTDYSKKLKRINWIKVQYKWFLILITNIDKIVDIYEKSISKDL
ncbi:6-hydroxymethylpterin diphosphokinase MptE-like protein [Sulfurimonas sp. CS5]|uniref:motility associated factor glycosyltransferase family protein n=1 Tax=Sulfurimonas sp. CS5 TaxID=3391145 RepID=UPI0039EB912C